MMRSPGDERVASGARVSELSGPRVRALSEPRVRALSVASSGARATGVRALISPVRLSGSVSTRTRRRVLEDLPLGMPPRVQLPDSLSRSSGESSMRLEPLAVGVGIRVGIGGAGGGASEGAAEPAWRLPGGIVPGRR